MEESSDPESRHIKRSGQLLLTLLNVKSTIIPKSFKMVEEVRAGLSFIS